MPIIGATLISVSIDETEKILTAVGTNFGENQYPASDIKCRINGSSDPYISVDSIDLWGNLSSVGSYTTALSAGIYDVQVVTSDNVTLTIEEAFEVESSSFVNSRSGILNDCGDENRLVTVNNFSNPDEDRYI
jgi:hypothetical protein